MGGAVDRHGEATAESAHGLPGWTGSWRRTPSAATLTLRLLPVGSNMLLNLVAGVSERARQAPFMAASAIGYLPQTVVFALLGGGVRVSQETAGGAWPWG